MYAHLFSAPNCAWPNFAQFFNFKANNKKLIQLIKLIFKYLLTPQ
jgi:hypothetical protein